MRFPDKKHICFFVMFGIISSITSCGKSKSDKSEEAPVVAEKRLVPTCMRMQEYIAKEDGPVTDPDPVTNPFIVSVFYGCSEGEITFPGESHSFDLVREMCRPNSGGS